MNHLHIGDTLPPDRAATMGYTYLAMRSQDSKPIILYRLRENDQRVYVITISNMVSTVTDSKEVINAYWKVTHDD